MMTARSRVVLDWLVPVVLLAALTIPFFTTTLDMDVASRFYRPGVGWPLGGEQPWRALKQFGVIPAWLIGLSALGVFIASFWKRNARAYRRQALYLVLALALGPGVVVNDVFKKNWGRPRPRDVVELGGDRAYVEPWVKRPKEMGGSFASGHAAMGFYLLVPYFLVRRRSASRATAWVIAGLGFGSLVGFARMVQGAHFLSDVLWSLGFVYLTGLVLLYVMGLDRVRNRSGPASVLPPS